MFTENQPKERTIMTPKFLQEEKGLSGAEKGTAMHFVMQKIDYEKVESLNDIKLQLEDMVKNELLTKDEFKAINPFKVLNFFKSDIGKRAIKVYENGIPTLYARFPF